MDVFSNDALRAAVRSAVGGKPAALESLLTRYGGLPGATPNYKLALAFGAEVGSLPESPQRLLAAFADDPSPAGSPRAMLPVAAAHGWVARLGEPRDAEAAWQGLLELLPDSRRPVRLGVLHALQHAARGDEADALLTRAREWLELEDPVLCFGASAVAFDVLSDAHVLPSLSDVADFLQYVSHAIDVLADAPRSASRLEGRRRMLTALTGLCCAVVKQLRAADQGSTWMAAECERATHPDVRSALSEALLALAKTNTPRGTVERLRKILESSAKPLRDASRVRPGSGRGKRSRSIR